MRQSGSQKVESAWPGKATGGDTVNATIPICTDFLVGTGPVEGSLVKLPTGTSSSTDGKTSELTLVGFEENVVVPVATPIGPVPVPTPFTAGLSISIESDGLWKALMELFIPEEEPKKEKP